MHPLNENAARRREFAARASDRIDGQSLSKKEDFYARAWLLRAAGRIDEAAAAYQAALVKTPDAVEWRIELAELLFDKGDYDGAEKHLRQILVRKPNFEASRELNIAVVRARLGIR
jgi:tetratricopeptide (TPR) repeat protein